MSASHRELSWVLLMPPLVVPTLGTLLYFVVFPEGGLGTSIYTGTKLFTLVYPFLFLKQIGLGGIIRRRRHDPTDRWPRWGTVLLTGLTTGLAIAAVGFVFMLTPLGDIVREGAARVSDKAEGMGLKDHFILFAIFISVIHSALEEFYWRWFTYGQLQRKMSRWAAHIVAAVAFGGHHLIVTLQFFPIALAGFLTGCVVAGGFIWSMMYEKQGTVIGSWISHLCVDVLLMVIGFQLVMGA